MKLHCTPTKILTGSRSCIPPALSNALWPASSLFPPQDKKAFHDAVLGEILEERVTSSRHRVNPRGVKRKMSNYRLRPRHCAVTQRIHFLNRVRIIIESRIIRLQVGQKKRSACRRKDNGKQTV